MLTRFKTRLSRVRADSPHSWLRYQSTAQRTTKPVAKKFPSNPPNPERLCWGCDKYCAVSSLACGNGSVRTQHPSELFGPDWESWEPPAEAKRTEHVATGADTERRGLGTTSPPNCSEA